MNTVEQIRALAESILCKHYTDDAERCLKEGQITGYEPIHLNKSKYQQTKNNGQ
jgi:hypothetical protein